MANNTIKDLVGLRFGKLVAIEHSFNTSNKVRRSQWLCKCDCGNSKVILATSLCKTTNPTRSCGCITGTFKPIEEGKSAFNQIYKGYKSGAKYRGLEFKLSKEEFKILTQGTCNYCGIVPSAITNYTSFGQYIYNGIDRVDNNLGYILSNCVACCKDCNFMKQDRTVDSFLLQCKKIVNYNESNGYYGEEVDFEEVVND